ncbi:MAG: diacylglycerol kinase family protein [Anaerolineae bacterium]
MKAQVILNPNAGQRDRRHELQAAMAYLEDHGWQLTLRETQGPGEATTYARQAAAEGYDVVIAAGGDGTVSEVANGLAGSEAALGIFPIGTTNVWALQMGIPPLWPLRQHSLLEAAKVLAEGHIRRVDLGQVNGRYFLLWAGVGLDAKITEEVEPEAKKRLGALAFVIASILVAKEFAGTKVQMTIDGCEVNRRAILIVASNAQLYAGIVRLAAQARLDDGLLDVLIFKGQGFPAMLRHLFSVLTSRHLRDPQVEYYQARRVKISSTKPLSVHADDEPFTITPVEIGVVPQALRVVVPQALPPGLFTAS